MIPTDEITMYTETALVSYACQNYNAHNKTAEVHSVQCSLNRQSMYTSMLFKLHNAEKLSNKGIWVLMK
jgi:hypothetical protein